MDEHTTRWILFKVVALAFFYLLNLQQTARKEQEEAATGTAEMTTATQTAANHTTAMKIGVARSRTWRASTSARKN